MKKYVVITHRLLNFFLSFFSIGFVVGLVLCSILLSVIGSAVNAVIGTFFSSSHIVIPIKHFFKLNVWVFFFLI